MKGSRAPRGMTQRNKETVNGTNYVGDSSGVSTPWGGGPVTVSVPTSGSPPTLTIPLDDDDDGVSPIVSKLSKRGSAGLRVAIDGTAARLRQPLKTIANLLTFIQETLVGTRTAQAFAINGVGGAVTSTAPGCLDVENNGVFGGTLSAGGSAGGVAAPTPAFVRGTLYKESGIFAAALVSSAAGGTFISGFNIASFVRNSTGVYTLTMNAAAVSAARLIPMATLAAVNGFIEAIAGSASTIVVSTFNSSGVLTDESFSLLAFAV
jgi:hypothetical protein